MNTQENMELAYKIAAWMDDPWTSKGRERYLKAIEKFEKLIKHPWFKDIKEPVKVLDLCSGKGIGGVAFVKVLKKNNLNANLVMVDIRRDAIEDAKKFALEENVKAEAYVMDALKVHKLGVFNIVLIYGAALAHFDEWSMVKLLASATNSLKENGVIVIEEMDRINTIFRVGFKEFIVENSDPNNLSISVHSKYDYLTGSYYRTYIRLKDFKSVTIPLNFRSIAHIASVLWLFVKDIDILQEENSLYFILGREPRRAIKPEELGTPKSLKIP